MDAISQTTFSSAFSWMKMFEIQIIEISLKFVPKGPINNIPALVQIMAWRRAGDKPLSEPIMVSLTTHICVTRLQWVNDVSMEALRGNVVWHERHVFFRLLTQCGLLTSEGVPKACHHWFSQWHDAFLVPSHCLYQCWLMDIFTHRNMKFESWSIAFHPRKYFWISRLQYVSHFIKASLCWINSDVGAAQKWLVAICRRLIDE